MTKLKAKVNSLNEIRTMHGDIWDVNLTWQDNVLNIIEKRKNPLYKCVNNLDDETTVALEDYMLNIATQIDDLTYKITVNYSDFEITKLNC